MKTKKNTDFNNKINKSMKLFLTDYASYNNGTQFEFGHWVDLRKYKNAKEFFKYINKHFEEADKKSPLDFPREEVMFTDFEGFPETLYNESMCTKSVQNIYDFQQYIKENYDLDNLDDVEDDIWIQLYNSVETEQIHINDEEFFEDKYKDNVFEAVRAVHAGSYCYGHDFVWINQFGNIQSGDELTAIRHLIDKSKVIEKILKELT